MPDKESMTSETAAKTQETQAVFGPNMCYRSGRRDRLEAMMLDAGLVPHSPARDTRGSAAIVTMGNPEGSGGNQGNTGGANGASGKK